LAQSLKAGGVDEVAVLTVARAPGSEHENVAGEIPVHHVPREKLAQALESLQAMAVVVQHWGIMAEVPELGVPLAIDLAGPHLLERRFWGDADPQLSLAEKLEALRRADFLVCSGRLQRLYFLPYLGMAGWDLTRSDLLPVIPFSVPPEVPPFYDPGRREAEEPHFVYGGAFLAWQDPSRPMRWLLEEMDRAGRGRLLFYGGSHPELDASGGQFAELVAMLREHPRVEMRRWRPFEALAAEYVAHGTVAFDLLARNAERELAYATRTVVYWWCGLPVMHGNYAETADVMRRGGGGWVLDPDNEQEVRAAIREVLEGRAPLKKLRLEARRLAMDHSWDRTGGALVEWAKAPSFRLGKVLHRLGVEADIRELREAREEAQRVRSELEQLEGTLAVRMARRFFRWSWLVAPLAWLVGRWQGRKVSRRLARAWSPLQDSERPIVAPRREG
jgi:hypothetical protein